ncbi:MAG TPA: hypothetical protein VET88_05270 [Gammaproteobacteria bacterium]|nr:hypothetical protein [Gammaproteobacteria bacterium]
MDRSSTWLLEYQSDIYTQSGEDGIIEKILETLPDRDNWCVEFGALDGKYLSNTRNLIEHKGFSAVLIEGSKKHFNNLQKAYSHNPEVITLNKYVGFSETDNLDKILSGTEIPTDYDFLSIDIDGNDYHVWMAASKYKPKVVCIEFNPTIPSEVRYIQNADPSVSQGSSLLSLVELGKEKGYELVSVIGVNALFVRSVYYPLFRIGDNSPGTLRTNLENITYIFSGYDGTILLSGCQMLPWHSIGMKQKKMQRLPFFLRRYPGNYNKIQLLVYGAYLFVTDPRTFQKRFKRFVHESRGQNT